MNVHESQLPCDDPACRVPCPAGLDELDRQAMAELEAGIQAAARAGISCLEHGLWARLRRFDGLPGRLGTIRATLRRDPRPRPYGPGVVFTIAYEDRKRTPIDTIVIRYDADRRLFEYASRAGRAHTVAGFWKLLTRHIAQHLKPEPT